MALVIDDVDAAEHAGLQRLRRIAEFAGRAERAAGRVDDRRDARDGAFEVLVRQRIDAKMYGLAGLQRTEIALGHVQHGLQRLHVDDLEQRLVDGHEIAELDRALGDHAGIGATMCVYESSILAPSTTARCVSRSNLSRS